MQFFSCTGTLVGTVLAVALMAAPVWAQTTGQAQPATDSSPGQTVPVRVARGLIVEFKPVSTDRQAPQAVREQLTAVAHSTGLPAPDGAPPRVGASGYLLRFAAPLQGEALDAAMQSVAADPTVQSVTPDVRMHLQDVIPNDPYFSNGSQWYLNTTDSRAGGPAALNLPQAWGITTGQAGPVVAVVDTGALFKHADLAGRFIAGYDFIDDVKAGNTGLGRNPDASDPGDWIDYRDVLDSNFRGCLPADSSWHGSFIAGIIGAASNNAIGVTGIAWNAPILPVRVSGKCGGYLSDIITGLRWAAGIPVDGVPNNPTPARIINLSIGDGGRTCDPLYQQAINEVTARGALVVVAAGNENIAPSNPANCAGVLAVGAVRQDGLKTSYSNFGQGTSLMAPGGADQGGSSSDWVTSTSNTGTRGPVLDAYVKKSGTSFAAPMAAGVAALMLAVNPSLTPRQLIALMQQSARPFPSDPSYPVCGSGISTACNCTQQTCGAGLLDANAAVQLARDAKGDGNPDPDPGSQGGGGATGWLWGLGLWGLAVAALRRRKV
jgi:serine protease